MSNTSPYFWTDEQQASQRLRSSVVLYDNEPVYVNEVRGGYDDNIPRAFLSFCKDRRTATKRLDSPKFGRFRTLPKLGWVNDTNGRPAYLERQTRRSVVHGLSNSNVTVFTKTQSRHSTEDSYAWAPRADDGGGLSFNHLCFEPGFIALQKGEYPSLKATLANIAEGQAVAYSPLFLVYRDTMGVRWLYRGVDRIGIFTGTETLNLFNKYAFYREEIMEDPAFTLNTIQEF